MFWLKLIRSFIRALRASEHPNQIAGGFALGFAAGFMPGWPLQVWLIVFFILLLNINVGMAFAGAGLAAALAWLFDPLIEPLGRTLLTQSENLRPIWIAMYNSPFWMLTRFNNTTMMGAFASSFIIVPLIFFGMRVLIKRYQTWLLQKIDGFRIVKWLRGSRVFIYIDRLVG